MKYHKYVLYQTTQYYLQFNSELIIYTFDYIYLYLCRV